MPSGFHRHYGLSSTYIAALAGLAVFAYGVVVALEPMTGLFGAVTAALGVLLLSDIAERGYPRALGRRGTLALAVVVVAVSALWVVFQRPLFGFGIAPLLAVVLWGLARFWADGYPESMSRRRTLTTAFVATGLVTYGSVSGSTAFLAGLSAAILVGLGSWATSPRGPVRGHANS